MKMFFLTIALLVSCVVCETCHGNLVYSDVMDGRCSAINGSLVINNVPAIQDLEFLKDVVYVVDNFQITNNANLVDISGMKNMFFIGGLFKISGNTRLRSLNGIQGLIDIDALGAAITGTFYCDDELIVFKERYPNTTVDCSCSCPSAINGQCDANNVCHCEDGFSGDLCEDECLCVNGDCDYLGDCVCNDGFDGGVCDDCQPEFYGANCTKCPICNSGTCDDSVYGSGECICDEGYTGRYCSVACDETCIQTLDYCFCKSCSDSDDTCLPTFFQGHVTVDIRNENVNFSNVNFQFQKTANFNNSNLVLINTLATFEETLSLSSTNLTVSDTSFISIEKTLFISGDSHLHILVDNLAGGSLELASFADLSGTFSSISIEGGDNDCFILSDGHDETGIWVDVEDICDATIKSLCFLLPLLALIC